VVVGTGEKILRLDPKIQSYMKKRNILLEVQDTVSFVVNPLKYKYFTLIIETLFNKMKILSNLIAAEYISVNCEKVGDKNLVLSKCFFPKQTI